MSDVQARIADDVKSNDVLLYMKGTPPSRNAASRP